MNAATWYAQLNNSHVIHFISARCIFLYIMNLLTNLILCAPGVAGQDQGGPHSSSFAGIDASRERGSVRYGAAVIAQRQDKQNPSSFRGPSFRTWARLIGKEHEFNLRYVYIIYVMLRQYISRMILYIIYI